MGTNSTELVWRRIRILHDELQDPFVMMPMLGAAASLSEALSEVESNFIERMGPYGVARKFWDVPTELLHEEKGFLIGNAFVLAQVAIAQAIGIFKQLRGYCRNCVLPSKKEAILKFKSEFGLHSGLSETIVIESVANYFKHQHEWPENWEESAATPFQARTLRTVKDIGMTPGDLIENMQIALRDLKIASDLTSIVCKVQSWREQLAHQLSVEPEIADSIGLN